MELKLTNTVCLDLRTLNGKSLDRVAESINTSFQQLEEFKKSGIAKIWIDLSTRYIVAIQNKKQDINILPDYCPLSKRQVKSLLNMTPISYSQVKKERHENLLRLKTTQEVSIDYEVKKLDIDTILDKILSEGLQSLTEEELEFLKKFS